MAQEAARLDDMVQNLDDQLEQVTASLGHAATRKAQLEAQLREAQAVNALPSYSRKVLSRYVCLKLFVKGWPYRLSNAKTALVSLAFVWSILARKCMPLSYLVIPTSALSLAAARTPLSQILLVGIGWECICDCHKTPRGIQ